MKSAIFFLLLFVPLGGSALASIGADTVIEHFAYPAEVGVVTFHHKQHSERRAEDCGFCHSALRTFGGKVDKLYGHNVCQKCHETHNGPTRCEQCHADFKGDLAARKTGVQ